MGSCNDLWKLLGKCGRLGHTGHKGWSNRMNIIFILVNIGIPLSCNFIGEFLSLLAAFEYSYIVGVLASLGMVLSAAYSMYLYNRVCFGTPSKSLKFSRDLSRREFYVLLPLVLLVFIIGVFPVIITDVIKNYF